MFQEGGSLRFSCNSWYLPLFRSTKFGVVTHMGGCVLGSATPLHIAQMRCSVCQRQLSVLFVQFSSIQFARINVVLSAAFQDHDTVISVTGIDAVVAGTKSFQKSPE